MRYVEFEGKRIDLRNPPVNSVVRTEDGHTASVVSLDVMPSEFFKKGLLWYDLTNNAWTVSKIGDSVVDIVSLSGISIEY